MFMSARSPDLSGRIAAEIAGVGPMRFARFMELALYDPQDGYYASGKARIGRGGDFFTNVSVGPVYGELLAGQFREMSDLLGSPADFTIVEQGAGDGTLAHDVLMSFKNPPRYIIIEPFEFPRRRQAEKLAGLEVEWVSAVDELPEFRGVHFSNELFDALPFDIFEAEGGHWHELLVDFQNDSMVFKKSPASSGRTDLPDGFRIERRRGQAELLGSISARMSSGFLLAVDYGMGARAFLEPHRAQGTLACFSAHRRDTDPLENPGEKDITAHVDFSALALNAVNAGFDLRGFADQHHFIVGAAEELLAALDGHAPDAIAQKQLRALRMLMHPETMGTAFKAILFSKGVGASAMPTGFRHARSPGFLLEEPATL
jgi:SAM-dependent MidA family methyltransferase